MGATRGVEDKEEVKKKGIGEERRNTRERQRGGGERRREEVDRGRREGEWRVR